MDWKSEAIFMGQLLSKVKQNQTNAVFTQEIIRFIIVLLCFSQS